MKIVSRRAAAAFSHDIVMAAVSFWLSFYLRVGDDIAHYSHSLLWTYDGAFTLVAAGVFFWAGLYRGIWRYASLPDLLGLARAASLVILIFFSAAFIVTRLEGLPRSLVSINWLVLMALLGGPRFAYRLFKDGSLRQILDTAGSKAIPILLIGFVADADQQDRYRLAAGGVEDLAQAAVFEQAVGEARPAQQRHQHQPIDAYQ